MAMSDAELSVTFFVQMCIILVVCRMVGWTGRRFLGQPQVVGEMIAGLVLGPSVFGFFYPSWQQLYFPPQSLHTLYICAQLGIGLFMFLIGIDFRGELLQRRARAATWISLAGMIVPFSFAVFLAPWLMGVPDLFSEKTTTFEAVLFMGAAISITAFPTLARIIYERGLSGTTVGTLALSAGAVGDAVAWCVLAVVFASFGERLAAAATAIVGGVAYAIVMLTLGQSLLARVGRYVERSGNLSHTGFALILALLMMCLSFTDSIGIHAVFGGFVLGVAMPRGVLTLQLRAMLEPIVVVFLLPIFFAYSGLNTQLHVIAGGALAGVTAVVLAASIFSKFAACWAAARLSGEDNRTSLAVGALMNARGLMELIIANIGLQKGVIKPAMFSILVLMTILTTLMASPLLELFYAQRARRLGELETAQLGE
jgi:Kef-type K+ transport system membrane component KefB